MSKFAGGLAQADYMSRIGQLPPQQCLVVPIDVGKRSATALVADHHGRIVQGLFEFDLTVSGTTRLITTVTAAEQRVGAHSVRARHRISWPLPSGVGNHVTGQGIGHRRA